MRLRAVLFDMQGVIIVSSGDRYQPRPGILELIADLASSGVALAVGTAAPRGVALATLDELGVLDKFAGVVGADDVKRLKPDPEVYRKALALTGARQDEAVVVDDSPEGVRAAAAANLVAVAAPLPGEWPPWRGLAGARLRVNSLCDLDSRRLDDLLVAVWGPAVHIDCEPPAGA